MPRRRNSKAAPAEDKISNLPDAVLSRIISFIPIKEAVTTSILSKKWIHQWHSIDTINFPNTITLNDIESTYRFNEFMYSLLVSREATGSRFINRFCLQIEYGNFNLAYNLGFPNVTKWVNLIVQRRLESLRLHIIVDDDNDNDDDDGQLPKLPISILTCRTLVSLDLRQFCVKGFSFSSIGFGFPSLNVLHLNDIYFQDLREFTLLLAGCPILEFLRVVDIWFYRDSFDYLPVQEFKSVSLPKLINAYINRCWSSCFPVRALSNSEYLRIETCMLHNIDHKVYEVNQLQCSCEVPIFQNLTHIELYDNWELVPQVLQRCPKLQKLVLYQEENDQQNWVEPELVPQCLSSYLRACTMHNFTGVQSEITLAKYILKNARNLQIMEIWNIQDHSEIERKLSTCPKASATCQLLIYDDDDDDNIET